MNAVLQSAEVYPAAQQEGEQETAWSEDEAKPSSERRNRRHCRLSECV